MYRSQTSATGLSMREGAPLREPSDLPDHRVEVHVFNNGDAAGAFVEGVALAGNPNRIACTWETGTGESNRTVLVARLDEPRPEGTTVRDCLPVIRHSATNHDNDARAESMRRIYAEREAHHLVSEATTAPLRAALEARGIPVSDRGYGWVRTPTATFQVESGGIRGEFLDAEDHRDAPGSAARIASEALARGFRTTAGKGEYEGGPYACVEEAADAVSGFEALTVIAAAIRREEWYGAFMAGMRMTPTRRKFLSAGAEEGISVSRARGNVQARAGGVTMKATDYGDLKRAGWVDASDKVTEAGLEAMGIPSAAPVGP